MYALTSSMKGTGRRFANMVFKKADVNVCKYSSHALDMKFRDDIDDLDHEHLKKIRVSVNPPFQASSIFSVNSRPNLNPPTRNMSTTAAAALPVADSGSGGVARIGEGKKGTKIETNVSVKINLNGSGIADCNCGIPLLDEMLHQFASHGLFDVHVKATGDIDVDERHTNEDVAIAIGTALQQALGDDDRKKGINRFGNFIVPLDDALVHVSLDLSGRGPHLTFGNIFLTNDVQLVKEFFKSLVNTSGITLHIRYLYGSNNGQNIIEPTFLAFAGALRQATEYDPNWRGVARIGEVKKVTKIETNVSVKINLDGSGVGDSNCGIPFLDEMLHQFASHGLFDVHVKATGDIHVDERHTNEDVALAIGTALQQALGDKKEYINRFGSFCATHNGALVHAALDLSGHPHLGCRFDYFGTYTELVKPFFESLVNTTGMTLHIRKLSGSNSRHIIEATFKAFAAALRQAIEYDPRRRPRGDGGTLPSSKGVLSQ